MVYLAADTGKWVTGQVLGVCGGMSVSQGDDFEELNRMMYGDEADGLGHGQGMSAEVRVGEPHRPLPVKIINFVGRMMANAVGIEPIRPRPRIDSSRKAIEKAGSSDFGGDDYREGPRTLHRKRGARGTTLRCSAE